jgi:glycosyltransferase involved in cell wall biosynthesis
LNGNPFQVGYFYNRRIKGDIQKLIDRIQPDHIYGQLVRVIEYIKDQPQSKTIDLQDALSAGLLRRSDKSKFFLRWILDAEYNRMKAYESEVLHSFNKLTIITQSDKDLFESEHSKKLQIVPNGVDLSYFVGSNSPKKYELLFTGNMNYAPNVVASQFLVEKIMPVVWKKFPKAQILLAGAYPRNAVLKLAGPRVTVSGWLDDIREAYADAKIFIAPMQIGTGLQNKLLEAMAMSLPCITTYLANDALKAKAGEQILVAPKDNAQSFADHIIKLLSDEEYSKTLANNGHHFVESNYNWEITIAGLNKIIESKL